MNVLSLLSRYSRNLHMKVIFNFHTPFFQNTHTTLSNASTSSQSHAPPVAVRSRLHCRLHPLSRLSHEPEPHMQPSRREMALAAVKPPRWMA